MSCLLFHGPGARVEALDEGFRSGRLLDDPFGSEGLKVEDARRVVELLMSTPVGSEKGVVIVGPMDLANWKASDVLLKSIEEFHERVKPILWAHDLGGVSDTIRSRCLERWCPLNEEAEEDDALVAAGYDIVYASLHRELWRIPEIVKQYKGREEELLGAATNALLEEMSEEQSRRLWARIRDVSQYKNPSPNEVVAAFLPSRGA